ncbi:MAG: DUF4249 domain-containing protein [Bacteroidota bacterium]|nr:DUF4249 domain-containing protein [Bacteroidota bacterium]
MKRYTAIAFLSACLFYSCKKTVVLNLDQAPSQIIIQGEVTNEPGPYNVTINQSVDFYADNTFPAVSGAIVRITDNEGATDLLTETSPGVYSTLLFQGKPGNTYTLSVSVQDKNYVAVSTMPFPVLMDSVTFETSNGFGQQQISAVVNFQDPAGIKNYYQFVEYKNGQQYTKNNFVFDDRLSDGKYIVSSLRNDSAYLKTGDQVEVKMYSIDAPAYNYLFQLNQSSGSGAFNNTASPANPASNISNDAFGYFSAHTTQSRRITVY